MKKNLTFIALVFISIFAIMADAAQRRVHMQTTRGILNKPISGTIATPWRMQSVKTTPITCPYKSQSSIQSFGTRTGNFARKHPKKLLAAGIAGTYVGIELYQHKKIHQDLEEFHEALWSNNPQEENLDFLILRLKERGGINYKNKRGNTPLMMVIAAARLTSHEQKKLFKNLLAHGAKPGQGELESALNVSSLGNVPLRIKPNFAALKALLPYYDQNVLDAFAKGLQQIITTINKNILDYKLEIYKKLREEYNDQINGYQKEISSPDFAQLNEGQQEEFQMLHNDILQAYKTIFALYQEKLKKEEEEQLMPFKRMLAITQKALAKDILSETSSYKESELK